ncbi:MAG: nuclear transport factor 2 family protein [Planctomycetes bacterium]|nr:nuclear transport factor 2 family protein [Planctomycetota bacterium]
MVFGRLDGGWRIVQHHASVPFHMDGSLRAAIDLAPQAPDDTRVA